MGDVYPIVLDDSQNIEREFDPLTDTIPGASGGGNLKFVEIDFTDSPYTITDEELVLVDTTGGTVQVNLPPSASRINGDYSKNVTIKKKFVTLFRTVNIVPDGAEEIDSNGGTTSISGQTSLRLAPDGNDWWIV